MEKIKNKKGYSDLSLGPYCFKLGTWADQKEAGDQKVVHTH